MDTVRELPIGIQDFEKLRRGNCLYVDKTQFVYQLAKTSKPYFLGRPRRFGKSLFLSTLKAYFEGNKKLFEGLRIAELEKDWTQYPVIYIDFNRDGYPNIDYFNQALDTNLSIHEKIWGKGEDEITHASRLVGLIHRAYKKTGQRVVVLIDEYDKPMISTMEDLTLNNEIRTRLKGFYGVLKAEDANLRFVFLTGVTKFSQVSVFSDLNHLVDISLNKKYAGICGISETELIPCFEPEINALAEELNKSYDDTLFELKKRYNGYHFVENTEGMYNPFSLLNTFEQGKLNDYWFETGTPTFLVRMLKNIDFDIKSLEQDVLMPAHAISRYRYESANPIPLLYQSGYLTIKGYEERSDSYTLGFPNEEVKYGFYNELLPVYMPETDHLTEFFVWHFVEDLLAGNVEGFMNRLKAFFAGIPYKLNNKTEKDYQTIFFVFFKLMGQFIDAEPCSAAGRADAVVTTGDTVYAFEFKLTGKGTAEKALKQIDEKGYLLPFTAGDKKLVKIGAEFSTAKRGLSRWVMSE